MNRLLCTELFCLLKESSQTGSNDTMERAYDKFVEQVETQNLFRIEALFYAEWNCLLRYE